jgi:hypothetical protein
VQSGYDLSKKARISRDIDVSSIKIFMGGPIAKPQVASQSGGLRQRNLKQTITSALLKK